MCVDLSQVITHRIHDCAVALSQMGCCIQRADKMWELLIPVQEQFYAFEAWFFGFELKAPFYLLDSGSGAALFGSDCGIGCGG